MENIEFELIQKALVVRHSHLISCGNFDDALKITKILFENQDEEGYFSISSENKSFLNYVLPKIISLKYYFLNWLKFDEIFGCLARIVNYKLIKIIKSRI
mgnify:CR=1 FL=1|jgi:hypothetical protein